jgi:hypothetical protein
MDTSIRMIEKKYRQKKRKCENTQQGVDKWTNEREILKEICVSPLLLLASARPLQRLYVRPLYAPPKPAYTFWSNLSKIQSWCAPLCERFVNLNETKFRSKKLQNKEIWLFDRREVTFRKRPRNMWANSYFKL